MTSNNSLLVPYVQDGPKWKEHYIKKALEQIHGKDMTRPHKETPVHANLVLPTTQMLAQVKSELKRDQKEQTVFAPIKPTPEFAAPSTSTEAVEVRTTRKRKAPAAATSSDKKKKAAPAKKKKNTKRTNLGKRRDIFNNP